MNRSIRFGLLTLALALTGSLRADDKSAPPPAADDTATLKADNKQLSDELAAAWKESADLKAKVDQLTADNAALGQKLDASKAELAAKPDTPAPTPMPASSDSSQQLAEAQDKLATALRSFSVLQDENADLKTQLDKLTGDNAAFNQQLDAAHASNAGLQAQAATATQIDPLRTQLRQAQDEISRLAAENEQLRTRVAIQSPGPGAARPAPLRPNTVAAANAVAAPAEAPPVPAAKTYVVAEGDTLTKISRKFYGTSGRWEDILKANHDILKDEKSLVVGSTLKIP
jgi:nucleoid-associated protein YgaU